MTFTTCVYRVILYIYKCVVLYILSTKIKTFAFQVVYAINFILMCYKERRTIY